MKQKKNPITVFEYICILANDLLELYCEEEAKRLAEDYCKEKLKLNNTDFILGKRKILNNNEIKKLNKNRDELIQGKPLQYIFNKAYFYGMEFFVNKNVLIPRQETELLVNRIIEDHKGKEKLKILDICSGSGCIGISLKKNIPEAEVYAIEISEEAIKVHKKNCKKNDTKIKIKKFDILSEEKFPFKEKFDIIISNPPYVLEKEKEQIHKNVLNYEPEQAIFVKNNSPFIFYERISSIFGNIATDKCKLYYEINEQYAEEIIKINKDNNINNNVIIKDLNNKNRIISGEVKKIF